MKWSNHVALTGALTYGITGDIFGAMLSGTSAVIPDMAEGKSFNRRVHRKVSHWFVPYMALTIASVCYIVFFPGPSGTDLPSLFLSREPVNPLLVIAVFCQYMSIGALMHICQDAFCGKVPLFNPAKKEVGLTLFITGSGKEYLLTVSVVLCIIGLRYLI
jgi:hypothetical protein